MRVLNQLLAVLAFLIGLHLPQARAARAGEIGSMGKIEAAKALLIEGMTYISRTLRHTPVRASNLGDILDWVNNFHPNVPIRIQDVKVPNKDVNFDDDRISEIAAMNIDDVTISDVMSYCVANAVPELPPKALSDVFDRLIWCFSDNGKGILNVRRDWLSGEDLFRVEVALAMEETFPYDTRREMVMHFDEIVKKWPQLKEKCNEILLEWDKQFERAKPV